jgi:apolipoprotein N-acyltransferase
LVDSNTILIAWPETAISIELDENTLNSEAVIQYIRQFLMKHPKVKIVSGMESFRYFEKDEKLTVTARKFEDKYYDSYNSAIMIDTSNSLEIYHKSILVPGVEKMPYPKLFRFLEKLTINLGGANGSLGSQKEASVFKFNDSIIFAPVICYESVFGDYLGDYVEKGANVMVIITNDGWWGTSIGYKQHLNYTVLRAIELRKFIIRSANTGISCFVDPSGRIIQPTAFWVHTAIKHDIQINNRNTFYAKNGDYLARIGVFAAFIFVLIWIPKIISEKFFKKR